MNNWSSKNFICPTPLLKFYLKEGALVKYHWCIAYERGRPFKNFIDGRTAARIAADLANKPDLSKLNKDINNSCYGRLSLNLRSEQNILIALSNVILKRYLILV